MSDLGNKEIMAKNIQYYMDKYEKTRQDMCDALGVKYTTFTDWVKGNSYPRIDKIELMANYFGISKADLVEEHPINKPGKSGVTINVYGRRHPSGNGRRCHRHGRNNRRAGPYRRIFRSANPRRQYGASNERRGCCHCPQAG